MMTKKNILSSVLGIAVMALLAACDKVSEADRYIKADMPEIGRKVLVEEFTGQFCVNCPDGHAMIRNIKSLYGDNVITVSIHAGQLAWDDAANGGLKTAEGDEYANEWKVISYPSIVVNHSGSPISNMAQWQDAVQRAMGKDANVDIDLAATLSDDGKTIYVNSKMLPDGNVNAKYQIWLTESNIVAFQQDMTSVGYDLNYVHNHVYRSSVNGIKGEAVSLAASIYSEFADTIEIDANWNVENLSVVAFLYDDNGVIQVEEAELNKRIE